MSELSNYRPRAKSGLSNLLKDIFTTAVFFIAIFTLLQLAIPRSLVHGRSMEPSFEEGQRLIISRLSYLFGDPERGDIIVFNSPRPREPNEPPLIKRVIGVPGDTVEFRNTQVYLNGQLLDEPYINEPCSSYNCEDGLWELGIGQYFVMGDNRNHSNDSRNFGPITRDLIIGQAILRFWPLTDIDVLDHYRYNSD